MMNYQLFHTISLSLEPLSHPLSNYSRLSNSHLRDKNENWNRNKKLNY